MARRSRTPSRVNPADGTGVIQVFKPLPPKNHRDGIKLAKQNITAYDQQRAIANECRPPSFDSPRRRARTPLRNGRSPAPSHHRQARLPAAYAKACRGRTPFLTGTPENRPNRHHVHVNHKHYEASQPHQNVHGDCDDVYERTKQELPHNSSFSVFKGDSTRHFTAEVNYDAVPPRSQSRTPQRSTTPAQAKRKRSNDDDVLMQSAKRDCGQPRGYAGAGLSVAADRQSRQLENCRATPAHESASQASSAAAIAGYQRTLTRLQKHWKTIEDKTTAIRKIQTDIQTKLYHLETYLQKKRQEEEQALKRGNDEQLRQEESRKSLRFEEQKQRYGPTICEGGYARSNDSFRHASHVDTHRELDGGGYENNDPRVGYSGAADQLETPMRAHNASKKQCKSNATTTSGAASTHQIGVVKVEPKNISSAVLFSQGDDTRPKHGV